MPIINYDEFVVKEARHSGGVTGSKQVKRTSRDNAGVTLTATYQLKPPITDNSFLRWAKAGGTDRENYGEVIASGIARGILITPTTPFEAAPDVSLVHDKTNKKVWVASKYLQGTKVRTLDEYIKELNPAIDLSGKKHVKFIRGDKDHKANPAEREFDISGEANANLRRDIARGIAASIMVGDHDINPGNFVVVTMKNDNKSEEKKEVNRVARIDFGHAFNDLLNTSEKMGGQVKNKNNRVLDFINRRHLAGIKLGDPSKVWRDFPGMIPTQEMADALRELSESKGLTAGLEEKQNDFLQLAKELKDDPKGIAHLKKTLAEISKNLTGHELADTLNAEDTIKAAFNHMKTFATENQDHMKDAAKLMQLQVDIDNIIAQKKQGIEPTSEAMQKIKDSYHELKEIKGIGLEPRGILWIKADEDDTYAFKGDLESYIEKRCKQLNYADKRQLESGILEMINRIDHYQSIKDIPPVSNDRVKTLFEASQNEMITLKKDLKILLGYSKNLNYESLYASIQDTAKKYETHFKDVEKQLAKGHFNSDGDNFIKINVTAMDIYLKDAQTDPYRIADTTLSEQEIQKQFTSLGPSSSSDSEQKTSPRLS